MSSSSVTSSAHPVSLLTPHSTLHPSTPTSTPSSALAIASTSSSSIPLLTSAPASSKYSISPAHPGCVLCGIVASAASSSFSASSPGSSPRTATLSLPVPGPGCSSSSTASFTSSGAGQLRENSNTLIGGKKILHWDADLTIYLAEGKERLAEKHVVIILNRHLDSVYDLGPADIPILSRILNIAHHLLLPHTRSGEPFGAQSDRVDDVERGSSLKNIRVGFMGSLMRDPQFPYTHLHAHAYLGPPSPLITSFWRRNVVHNLANWWDIEDLRAEIRESSSNNRVKSGYQDRRLAPIDHVPDAGAIFGLPNALEGQSMPSSQK